MAFRTWQDSLPAAVEVFPIRPPGREIRFREPPFTHITPLVEALAQAMSPYLDKPFAFFGHSVGSLVAFELTRWLRRQRGLEPVHLFVSGRYAPHLPDPDPPIYQLPEPEFIEQVRRYNGTPQQVLESAELMELLLPVLRADFQIHETYEYTAEPPLACPISVFGGWQDPKMKHEGLEDWRVHTTGSFSLTMFEGDHFFLNSASPHFLQTLSQQLQQVLLKVA